MSAEINQKVKDYTVADQILTSWITAAETLGLLRGALRVGIFDVLRNPSKTFQIAATTNIEESSITDICRVLAAQGILELNASQEYQVAPVFRPLFSLDTVFPLEDKLDAAFAQTQLLKEFDFQKDYSSLPSQVKLTLAQADSVNPTSAAFQRLSAHIMRESMPEWESILANGGHHLELGCGVGGGLLALIYRYPKMSGVGVDINPDVLEVARQKASKLGVTERVDWWLADARTLAVEEAFDTIFWSQSYFSFESRMDTLRVALKALKPGGLLYAQVQNTASNSTGEANSVAVVEPKQTLQRLLQRSFGLPTVTTQDLREELENAGFEFERIVPNPQNQGVLVKRP